MVSLITVILLAATANAFVIPFSSKGNTDMVKIPTPELPTLGAHGHPLILPRQTQSEPVIQLLMIVPSAKDCSSSPALGECATAADAVDPIIASFTKYKITTVPEQAALLSWMAFETAEFKYDKNHFPGRPGQGTRNMMMPDFVAEYAASINVPASTDPAVTLDAVVKAGGEWGSAAWFYATKCSDAVKQQVKSGGKAGWTGFVSGCVGTTVDEGSGDQSRTAYWTRSMEALGGSTN